MSKNVLIIGGCGYIGSELYHFLQTLKNQNQIAKIDTVDLEWFGNYLGSTDNVVEDFANLSKEDLAVYDSIILLAGHSSVKMCQDNLNAAFKNNVFNFISLIQKLDKQQFIYASSSSVYGSVNRSLMDETCEEYNATNYYDLSKYEIDAYMKLFGNLEYYGLRFGTVNGPSPNLRDDVMINAMFANASKSEEVKITNPNIRRPILGIHDLCRAVATIIVDGDKSKSGIYNLASFNSTVELIGMHVADELGAKLIVGGNTAGAYDFAISTKKFETTFNFSFQESVRGIVNKLVKRKDTMILDNRNEKIPYGS
jgi:UDP-glucose 4-epimerase